MGLTGGRLATWAGLSPAAFRQRVECVNLFDQIPQRWTNTAARDRACLLTARCHAAGVVVLLGQRVADAFEHRARIFEWDESGGTRLVQLPHPSGLNHYWNEPAHVALAERFLRRLLRVETPRPRQVRLQLGRVDG